MISNDNAKQTKENFHSYYNQVEYSRRRQLELIDRIIAGDQSLEKDLTAECLLEQFLQNQIWRMLGSLLPQKQPVFEPFQLSDKLLVTKLVEVG